MKLKIKLIAGLIFLFLGLQLVNAQLFQTRDDIINKFGYNYTTGIADNGTKYIIYYKEITSIISGNYIQAKVIYFMETDKGIDVCYMWKIIEPSSETNDNVTFYKSELVETGYMQWTDYEKDIVYDIIVKNGLCIVTAQLTPEWHKK